MKNSQELSDFGMILLFMIGAMTIVGISLLLNSLLRTQKPNPVKLMTYESGEDTIGNTWGHFNIRFYVIGLIFLLFEVELLFLFPYSVVLANPTYLEQTQGFWGWFVLVEIFIFIIVLAIGLLYVWKKGFLAWEMPKTDATDIPSFVPKELYEQMNEGK